MRFVRNVVQGMLRIPADVQESAYILAMLIKSWVCADFAIAGEYNFIQLGMLPKSYSDQIPRFLKVMNATLLVWQLLIARTKHPR
jgi:hypothetical protein